MCTVRCAEPTLRIERLRPDALHDAAIALASAFRDNPLNVAVIRGDAERRVRANRWGMLGMLPAAFRSGLVLGGWRASELAGVLVATPPLAHPLPPPRLGLRMRLALGQGLRTAARWARVFAALQQHHPTAPHWYLGSIGVVSSARRRGVGSALVRRLLARADRDALPVYLETDVEENLRFYQREGFSVLERMRVLEVTVWRMSRQPGRV